MVFALGGCGPVHRAFKITDISAWPEPKIGEIVTVRVEVTSTKDEPEATIVLVLPNGVKLVSGTEPYGGKSVWRGSLAANQPHSYDVQVYVLYEGDWAISINALAQTEGTSTAIDSEAIYIISNANSGQAIPSWQYSYTPTDGPAIPNTPLPEIPPAGICP